MRCPGPADGDHLMFLNAAKLHGARVHDVTQSLRCLNRDSDRYGRQICAENNARLLQGLVAKEERVHECKFVRTI